ncbi:hypothetical protein EW146_g3458 [Bondarzewia mesenterica]|uniref:Uncharacterized protein n=1 Tax=Bondarzewia mesenterica TaxID=1095465 RepID=A0A4S4LZR0_9AGAM|nr:hypothetical protein EW146_g3458 [Bondarzewia mesenterica]
MEDGRRRRADGQGGPFGFTNMCSNPPIYHEIEHMFASLWPLGVLLDEAAGSDDDPTPRNPLLRPAKGRDVILSSPFELRADLYLLHPIGLMDTPMFSILGGSIPVPLLVAIAEGGGGEAVGATSALGKTTHAGYACLDVRASFSFRDASSVLIILFHNYNGALNAANFAPAFAQSTHQFNGNILAYPRPVSAPSQSSFWASTFNLSHSTYSSGHLDETTPQDSATSPAVALLTHLLDL